ncbi:MAG TPA: hypothetical protein VGX95_05390 [Xanthobacteraceae bacterium]|jgi:hypothetical protein|nr:hypothetical protein [Xanthobacteraceae bacterium]
MPLAMREMRMLRPTATSMALGLLAGVLAGMTAARLDVRAHGQNPACVEHAWAHWRDDRENGTGLHHPQAGKNPAGRTRTKLPTGELHNVCRVCGGASGFYHGVDWIKRNVDNFPRINVFHEGFDNSLRSRRRTQYLAVRPANLCGRNSRSPER